MRLRWLSVNARMLSQFPPVTLLKFPLAVYIPSRTRPGTTVHFNRGFCMLAKANARRVSVATLILCLSLLAWPLEATARKKKPIPKGTPVLWRAPEDIASRDLYLGPGGAAMKPSLRRIKFIKEVKGGYSKKYRIRDAAGRVWVAKIGKEAQSETAAVRLLWAAGYVTEINYLVPRLRIPAREHLKMSGWKQDRVR